MKQTKSQSDIKVSTFIYLIMISALITILVFYFVSLNDKNMMSGTRVANANSNTANIEDLSILDEAKFKEDYIYVDLANMSLSTFVKGEKIKTYEIVSKGKPGSYYETPAGNYEVLGKYGDKFSSLGEVYMPSAIQFQGNYFIHGIPYYANGKKVSTTYSGGCIRLSDSDAEEVYKFANKGVRVIVTSAAETLASDGETDLGQENAKKLFHILISLDVSNQERMIRHNGEYIKALDLIPLAINGDEIAYNKILNSIYQIDLYENNKIKALGLSDSSFDEIGDRITLYNYIKSSKSYLLKYL